MSANKALPSLVKFPNIIGRVLGHLHTDVVWLPSSTIADVRGHRVATDVIHLDGKLAGKDYFPCKAWAPQRSESDMIMTAAGIIEKITYTLRVDANDYPFNFRDDAVDTSNTGFHSEVRITDVFVFDYFTHTKPAHAYRVISVYDDSDFSGMIRITATRMGTKDAVFLGEL